MKRGIKLFLVYGPVIIVASQVAVNLLYFISKNTYMEAGFYLNTFFGTNMLFALFLLAFTFMFKFCAISRWAAIAEVLFGVNYLVVQEDNLYNIMFQVIVGTIALIFTISHYTKSFPLCRLSLLVSFIKSVILSIISSKSCKKGLERGYEQWERDVKSMLLRNHRQHGKQHT